MARQAAWILAAAVASAVPASASPVALCEQAAQGEQRAPQSGESNKDHQKPQQGRRPLKFWQGETKTELGITNQQSTEIEQIFRATLPKLEASKEKLDQARGGPLPDHPGQHRGPRGRRPAGGPGRKRARGSLQDPDFDVVSHARRAVGRPAREAEADHGSRRCRPSQVIRPERLEGPERSERLERLDTSGRPPLRTISRTHNLWRLL